ncbi:FtsK/SpoIIIE domain-containing protein [Microbacterium sp. NPDC055683]
MSPSRIDEPITIPAPAPPVRSAPWPLFASAVPLVGGVVMWLLTGSMIALCFAALGPLMAVAAIVDRRRGARRVRRRDAAARAEELARIRDVIDARHAREREELERRCVDLGALLADDRRIWRVPGRELVVGRGDVSSRVRVAGGTDDEDVSDLHAHAETIADSPIAIDVADGVCVRGDDIVARAVARALVLQLCLRLPPDALHVAGCASEGWTRGLPHARPAPRALSIGFACAGETTPAGTDAVVVAIGPDEPVPATCGVLIEVEAGLRGRLIRGAETREIALEAVAAAQAEAAASTLARRPLATADAHDPLVALSALDPAPAAPVTLPAVIGTAAGAPAVVDLVADGPHALVVGTTGAGKSELLVTWVASMARAYPPERVVFLLADFKGGTAFDTLAGLPHTTGVVTDLDPGSARRAVESLRAEIRRREQALAAVGERDVSSGRAGLPRLVIVVDEFAALLQDHPDLHAVFADVAARGRALGMHLVLGTQRATGIVRDGLVANCPLRIALRVAESAESRAVIGTDDAALLPGDDAGRGLAYVRRASDASPRLTRIALSSPDDVAHVPGPTTAPRGPWLPPLPSRVALHDIPREAVPDGAIVLGIADEPAEQRQPPVLLRPRIDRGILIVGGPGSGRTTAARLVVAQHPDAVVVPADAEAAWDAIESAERRAPGVLVIDDVDMLLARYPNEHAQAVSARIESLIREAGDHGMTTVLTTARMTGPVARIGDLLPRRALLATASRIDHAAAGGDGGAFDPRRPPGRAILDGVEMQFALGPAVAETPVVDAPRWRPEAPITAFVARSAPHRGAALQAAWGRGVRLVVLEELPAGGGLAQLAGPIPVVVAGDPESWQRQWSLLQEARARCPLVIGAECAAEVRALTGDRELPPYARTRASRAWLYAEGRAAERIVLP